MTPIRSCIFCGGRPVTVEDAIPLWLLRLVYPKDTVAAVHRGRERSLQKYETINPKARVKIACAQCNNGWMSDLEVVVRPLLTPWVLGKLRSPTIAQQQALATWAVKTAATLEHTQAHDLPHHVFPSHLQQLADRQIAPPDNCYVWITVAERPVPAAFIIGQQAIERDAPGVLMPARTLAYDAMLAFANARIKVLGLATEIHPRLQDHIGLRDALRVWPPEQSGGVFLP